MVAGLMWKRIRRWKKQMFCVGAGAALYLLMEVTDGSGGAITYLKRGTYGEGEVSYNLLVEGIGESTVSLDVQLEERIYTKDQAEDVFREIYENISADILGNNTSLKEVRENLNLITDLSGYGVRIRWSSDNPQYLDAFGEVHRLPLGVEEAEVVLGMELSDGIHRQTYELRVMVLPPILSEEEEAAGGLMDSIKNLDRTYRTEDGISLPREYDGKTLYYRDQEETDNRILLVLGVLLAGLCYAKDQSDKKELLKNRSHQMLLDYSEIVSKLMVFFGAGMTVFAAWERVVKDYEQSKEKQKKAVRHAYEEMCYSYYQMRSGVPEGQVYREFGARCRLQPYSKLASLLEQNRKNGMKNLRSLMEMEMADAFEQRKNTAKRLGEEASTKLLIPLFFMLAVVMVMIVLPAFLAFY